MSTETKTTTENTLDHRTGLNSVVPSVTNRKTVKRTLSLRPNRSLLKRKSIKPQAIMPSVKKEK